MKKSIVFFLVFFCALSSLEAQVKYEMFQSSKLQDERQIKIQLPRGYSSNSGKDYPLFIVFDGDYLFEAVAGNVDYYSYWDDMPESIVVGINQVDKKFDDCLYSEENSLPIKTGAAFFDFVGLELMPYLEKNYRVGNFKVAVGHGDTANFINYFLLRTDPIFRAYVSINPDLAPDMLTYMVEAAGKQESKTFYYLANTDNSPSSIKKMSNALNTDLSAVNNKNFLYKFQSFEGPSHYSVPAHAIPNALESIFHIYQPISKKEYLETILKLEISPVTYLQEKYQAIEDLFGIEKQVLVNDFKAISAAIQKNETFEYFEELGKMGHKYYPETLMGSYYLGRFYEETGEPRKAMKAYLAGYPFSEIAGIKKDELLERTEAIKADFGY